jgi:flagellar hook protein FlgE
LLGQNLLGSTAAGGEGLGVVVSTVEKIYAQGALLGTGVTTDLAIDGQGFFTLSGEESQIQGNFYSRAGQFHLDSEGFLVNPGGLKLLGFPAQDDGTIGTTLAPIEIGTKPFPPSATTDLALTLNLDANDLPKVDAAGNPIAFDVANPDKTANFATSVIIYDELGQAVQADVFFNNTAPGEWEYHFVVDGAKIDGGTPGEATELSTGTLSFDQNGDLSGFNPVDITFTPSGGAADLTFKLDFKDTTQWANTSAISDVQQDGSQAGNFQSLMIERDGTMIGTFSNGKTRKISQIALAKFRSTFGLRSMGSGLFVETPDSGAVTIGAPNTVGRGQIHSGALEQSNVDLAHEFTQLILAQRGYQANTRSISTADQMMQETLNIKR